jgi:hypothetical protein
MIPTVRGFAPLNSKDSNVLSGMVFLQNLNLKQFLSRQECHPVWQYVVACPFTLHFCSFTFAGGSTSANGNHFFY